MTDSGALTCEHWLVQAIMLVESMDGSKVLLGRAKTIRLESMLTCLSGFVEQVETIEEACRREVMEEAGISVGPVHIAGSQPWPMGTPFILSTVLAATSSPQNGTFPISPYIFCTTLLAVQTFLAHHSVPRTCRGACVVQACIISGRYCSACMLPLGNQSV